MKDSAGATIDPLSVPCPYCKSARGYTCVYTVPQSLHYTTEQLRTWPTYAKQFARVGQPTKQPHRQRSAAARQKAERDLNAEWHERRMAESRAAAQDKYGVAFAARAAEAQFDREERRQLVWWLARHADVLIG